MMLATFAVPSNILKGYDTDARPLVCSAMARRGRTGSTWFAKEMHTASPCVARWIPLSHHRDYRINHATGLRVFTMLNSEITSDMIKHYSPDACQRRFTNIKREKTALSQEILKAHGCNSSFYFKSPSKSCPYIVTGFNTNKKLKLEDLPKCDYVRVLELTRINILEQELSFVKVKSRDFVKRCMSNSPDATLLSKNQMAAIQWHQELCTNQTERHTPLNISEKYLTDFFRKFNIVRCCTMAKSLLYHLKSSIPKKDPRQKSAIAWPHIPQVTYEFLVCLSAHRPKHQTVGEILADLYFNPENVDKHGRPTFKNIPVMDKIITRPALPIMMDRTKIDNILRGVGKQFIPLSRRGLNCSHIADMARRNVGLRAATLNDLNNVFVEPLSHQSIVHDL